MQNSRYVPRETYPPKKLGLRFLRYMRNVSRETHLRFAQNSGIDFTNAFAYSGAQHLKIKSWDV
jgi:hypothetical protein